VTALMRRTVITADDIRAYSRRGNYHSDPDTAKQVGLPGLVAQGVQVAGPAYAALVDEWGEAFLAHGEIDLRFVGMVLAEHEIAAHVTIDGDEAAIDVENTTTGRTAVVGTARASASRGSGETA
jgi:acyl dehydratase